YPPQPYPPQTYPPQPYPPQQYPPYGWQPPPPPQVDTSKRSNGEMAVLYGASVGYGVGTGIWIDALGKGTDPGSARIAPLTRRASPPLAVYFWDNCDTLRRGVPASIATGLLLGAGEGVGIASLNWQANGNGGDDAWSFRTNATVTFLGATAGGVG